MLNFRLARPDHLVDLNGLSELDYVRGGDGDDRDRRACAPSPSWRPTRRSVLHVPLLAHGAGTIGHYAIRSVARSAAAWRMPTRRRSFRCSRVLLDADVLCRSASGARGVPASDFFQSIMTTALEPGEAHCRRALSSHAAAARLGVRIVQPAAGRFCHCRCGRVARAR